ncbi:MAG: hypothetical protein OHK0046_41930 [Anaerolineae bacterium]
MVMTDENTPYIDYKPGALITAESTNEMQVRIKQDIIARVRAGIEGIDTVPNAENADKLENKTLEQIYQTLIERILAELRAETGYRRVFKKLKTGQTTLIEHGLGNQPLVDVYALDYFRVVSTESGTQRITWVNFYIYHSGERRFRERLEDGSIVNIEIEPSDGRVFRVSLEEMLNFLGVAYNDDTSLADLENELWKKLNMPPHDDFDDDQYTHSPWFDKCCTDSKTVADIKRRGDWNDIWVQTRPRKTLNLAQNNTDDVLNPAAPMNVEVVHYGTNKLGLTLVANPDHLRDIVTELRENEGRNIADELKVMVLLKV